MTRALATTTEHRRWIGPHGKANHPDSKILGFPQVAIRANEDSIRQEYSPTRVSHRRDQAAVSGGYQATKTFVESNIRVPADALNPTSSTEIPRNENDRSPASRPQVVLHSCYLAFNNSCTRFG